MKTPIVSNPLKLSLQFVLLLAIVSFNFGNGSTQNALAQSASSSNSSQGSATLYRVPALSLPPSNDDFASPTLITGLKYSNSLDTTGATQDTTDPDNVGPCDGNQLNKGNNTVWYQYTPNVDESIAADTQGSTTLAGFELDTYIAVWTGTEGNLSLVKCDDDDLSGYTSQLSFIGTANTTYYFEVAMYNGDYGSPYRTPTGGNLIFNVNITNTDVKVGTTQQSSYYLTDNDTIFDLYPSVLDGPVKVINIINDKIITSQRVTSGDSYNEIMGYPATQFAMEYWFPYYDHGYPSVVGSNMRSWILVGNPSPTLTATVNIYIGGVLKSGSPFSIAPGSRITPRWIGSQGGPVQVVSDIPIFASERVFTSNNNSFNETLGYPASQFTSEYWFPWYDDVNMTNYILVGNTSLSQVAHVKIFIAGVEKESFDVPVNTTLPKRYAGQIDGPVRVVSTNGVNIVTSQKTVSGAGQSYNEVMGYPFNQFADEYWFPYYDHGYPYIVGSNMRTWVLVGNPSTTLSATVNIYIDGVLKTGSPFTIPPGGKITPRWIGLQAGPVNVVSDIPIFASERVLTAPNSVFNEMMGYPASQMTSEYWFPWYDSINMINDIIITKP